MDVFNDILLWVHFVALAMGGAASFGIPVIGARMPTAPAEARPVLVGAIKGISMVSRTALGLLIITGFAMVWTRYNGDFAALGVWFWVKMGLVVLLLLGVIYAGMLLERSSKGDAAAAKQQRPLGMATTLVLLGIVFAAVMAFH